MVKLIMVRHGYSVYNNQSRFSGQIDVELNEQGVIQAQETADYLVKNYKIDKIYSSDLVRAKKTAELVSNVLDIPIIYDKDLRELDVGKWGGLTFDEVKVKYPDEFKLYTTNFGRAQPVGGEKISDFIKRIENVIHKIAKESDGKTVLISTHGGVVRSVKCAFDKIPLDEVHFVPRIGNSSISILEYDNDVGKMTLYGYNDHLTTIANEQIVN